MSGAGVRGRGAETDAVGVAERSPGARSAPRVFERFNAPNPEGVEEAFQKPRLTPRSEGPPSERNNRRVLPPPAKQRGGSLGEVRSQGGPWDRVVGVDPATEPGPGNGGVGRP